MSHVYICFIFNFRLWWETQTALYPNCLCFVVFLHIDRHFFGLWDYATIVQRIKFPSHFAHNGHKKYVQWISVKKHISLFNAWIIYVLFVDVCHYCSVVCLLLISLSAAIATISEFLFSSELFLFYVFFSSLLASFMCEYGRLCCIFPSICYFLRSILLSLCKRLVNRIKWIK